MLTTEKSFMKNFTSEKRLWQGIPSIAVTPKGRVFLTFYSGGHREQIGNFVVLIQSDDGVNFSEPVAVCYEKEHRCYDPCLWMDPLNRMWLTWSRCPDDGLYGAICEDPDADELVFGEEFLIGHNVMMNKPTVLSSGEWAFPIAVWDHENGVRVMPKEFDWTGMPAGSYMFRTSDQGKTFQPVGCSKIQWRSFDEHQFLEKQDGSIQVYARTSYGIGSAISYDGGVHWGEGFETKFGGPCSRFFIGRMPSGRVLMINHYKYTGRNNLTAMLSEDDGETFSHYLLLDGRDNVSYPDVQICDDGTIYVCYDRERGGFQKREADALACAREVLYARITEADIMAGELVNEDSFLQRVANKLGAFDHSSRPFDKYDYYTDAECAAYLHGRGSAEKALEEVFSTYEKNLANVRDEAAVKLDQLETMYRLEPEVENLTPIIALLRNVSAESDVDGLQLAKEMIGQLREDLRTEMDEAAFARQYHYSRCYIAQCFQRYVGGSVADFRKQQRLFKAKQLLKDTDCAIAEVAAACGFACYDCFVGAFTQSAGMAPEAYRCQYR